ncbi:unnamed protein product [Adineta steineri]|uniref:Uncharacterized protein n=1 Tax=Adineta steineri TaxID=433720 RepID=A0A814VYL1_9BILA|nr:unnamed protein product [Adineta steineri]CAF1188959.1 unnamed protein product [Adineta steineri]CAF1194484.1 unnamed protein product [Adineta steineri]
MVNEKLILFGINSLVTAPIEPIKSIEELRTGEHFINIITQIEAQKFAESRIDILSSNESVQEKFKFILEYLSKQSTSSITEWNINELIRGNDILLSKTALLVVFAAHADTYFYSKSLETDENQHEQLAALFDLHMIEATQNNPYQLNIDACLKEDAASTQPKQTTPVIRKRRNTQICNLNDSLNNNNRSSILDRSFTRSPGSFQQSHAAVLAANQQARVLQEDLFKVQYELDDLQHKYGGLEKSYHELKDKNREYSEKILRQTDYDTIKDERNKLREDVHRYEIDNKRLQGVKENVTDLQQRLQQYQKKNDEMHEKVATLERKLRESKQQCDEYSKKIVNQNADILLLSSVNERVKMLEIENQQMKIIKEQRETELLRQIRHLQDDKEELQKQLDEPMTTTETPLIVAEKRALEEELHILKMSFYDRREADTEIESFKQTIKQLEEKLEQLRNECQELYKQKHEYAEEQIALRNELNAQLETYENKLYSSTKLVEELKRENAKTTDECNLVRSEIISLKSKLHGQSSELNSEIVKSFDLRHQLGLLNEQVSLKSAEIVSLLTKIDSLKVEIDHIKFDRDNCQTRLIDLQMQYDKLTNTCSMYESKLNEQEERETELKLQVQHVREMYESIIQEKVHSQTEYTDAQMKVSKAEQALKDKIEEVENLKKAARLFNQDIKELEKYGEDLREHYEKSKVTHKKTEQELDDLKSIHSKTLHDYDELQKQASALRSRCNQLESERLPLIAQLEFADRNLRQVKKQQQQQQQTAMTTSTTVHHQPPAVLQSIENNNKSISRLIRSPSLDMRVMRRTNDKMDDTRSLDHDDLALLLHKNQSYNNFPLNTRSTDLITKYEIENEDEPIHLDLGPIDYDRRMTELQRRNLSQPKHLRTAYALETMERDPDQFSASFIRKGGAIHDEQSVRQRIINENKNGSETPKASRFKNLFNRK